MAIQSPPANQHAPGFILFHLVHIATCFHTPSGGMLSHPVNCEWLLKPHNLHLVLEGPTATNSDRGFPLLGISTPLARKAGMLPDSLCVSADDFAKLALFHLS